MFANSNFLPTAQNGLATGAIMPQMPQTGAINPQMLQMLMGLGGGLQGQRQPQQMPQQMPQQPMMMGQGMPRQQTPIQMMPQPQPFQPRMSMGLQRGLGGGY